MEITYLEVLDRDVVIHILININSKKDIESCLDLFPIIRDLYLWKVKSYYDFSRDV